MLTRIYTLALVALLVTPAAALADGAPPPQPTLALPTDQVWTLIAGGLAPLAAYLLNHYLPHTSEKIKAFVHVIVAAVAGGVMEAITAGAGTVGFNTITLQFVLSAVVAALSAHKLLWQPSTISTALGAGSNAP